MPDRGFTPALPEPQAGISLYSPKRVYGDVGN